MELTVRQETTLGLEGRIILTVRDARTGRIRHRRVVRNISCTAGESVLAALLNGETVYGGSPIPQGLTWTNGLYGAVGTGAPNAWQASTSYALNSYVHPTTPNGFYYRCTTAGTSGTTQPTWPTTVGQTVTDGTCVWTCAGPARTDTALLAELARVGLATNSRNQNVVLLTWFYNTSQANGNITEAGAFLLGTSTAGSGYLLDHAYFFPAVPKNNTETATLQIQFTLA